MNHQHMPVSITYDATNNPITRNQKQDIAARQHIHVIAKVDTMRVAMPCAPLFKMRKDRMATISADNGDIQAFSPQL